MSSTRSVKSPGVWGADASTSIPASPLAGVSYRNTGITSGQTRGGWPFDTLVDSAKFNEMLYRYTSLLDVLDRQGVLGWSDQVDYAVPALAWGSDGAMYRCLLASGPSSTVRDPVSAPAGYWEQVTPAGASVSKATNGWAKLPGGLIVQWGAARPGDFAANDSGTQTFPITFPNACLWVGPTAYGEPPNAAQYAVGVFGAPSATGFPWARVEFNTNSTPGAGFNWLAIGH